MSAGDLNYAYLESGVDPFIVGAGHVPFSAHAYARECCRLIAGEIAPTGSEYAHPCDLCPPPRILNDPPTAEVLSFLKTVLR